MTTTPLQILKQLREQGLRNQFIFRDGKMVCVESGKRYSPLELEIVASYRFEGTSNPDDLSIALVFKATDGTGGVFTDAFGINGDPKAAEFCAHIPDRRKYSEIMEHVPAAKIVEIGTRGDGQ